MQPTFTLECFCSHRLEPKRPQFVARALDFLVHMEDIALERREGGLVVMAETEPLLERPLRIVREVYGDQVCVGDPRLRFRRGKVLEEPVMIVRVLSPSRFYDAVQADFVKRGVTILDTERNAQFGVVRGSAPLSHLMGYARAVANLSQGQAREVMWFSHYAPAPYTERAYE